MTEIFVGLVAFVAIGAILWVLYWMFGKIGQGDHGKGFEVFCVTILFFFVFLAVCNWLGGWVCYLMPAGCLK
jgi:hypothetical protein